MAGLYTLGYGSLTPEEFVKLLSENGISVLADVRSNPFSSFKSEYNKEPFSIFLAKHNVKYVFLGRELGGHPNDPDCYDYMGHVLYEKCKGKKPFLEGVQRLKDGLVKGLSICLMCGESKPEECHRSKLIAEFLFESGLEVSHILPNGSLIKHAQLRREFQDPQTDLFDQGLRSRKSLKQKG